MRIRYQIMLLMVAVLGVYYPSISVPMISVDDPALFRHMLNNDSFRLGDIFFPGGTSGYYRPLLVLSLLIDKYVWGLELSFMHLNNILLHLFNTLLVFAVARKAAATASKEPGAPFVASLLFAVHPINTESVNWLSGRTDPLSAFFLLLGVYALLFRSRPALSSCTAALCLLLACLAKESAIFWLPAALAFPFFLPRGAEGDPPKFDAQRWMVHAGSFVISAAGYFVLRALAFSKPDEGLGHVTARLAVQQDPQVLLKVKMVFKAIGFYSKKLFIPFPLSFGITNVSDGYVLAGVVALAAILYLMLRRTLASFFWASAATVGCSALLVGLLNITWTPLAERYMYIPSAFFLLGLTMSLQQWEALKDRRALVTGLVALLAVGGCYGSYTRNLVWGDNITLFQDTVNKNPGFMAANNELAFALSRSGRTAEAVKIYSSLRIDSDIKNYQYAFITKADTLAQSGDFEGGRQVLREALKKPGRQEVEILERMLAVDRAEMLAGKASTAAIYDNTVRCLTRLYELTGNPFYQYRLGVVNLKEKQEHKALAAFRTVCRTAPKAAFYFAPAEKLSAKLETKLGESAGGTSKK